MKKILFYCLVCIATVAIAQTPIDELQKRNLSYLEAQENQDFEFRSQIITEFDQAHATQNVNIKLSKDFTYIVVALGDSNIPDVNLDIKPASNTKLEIMPIADEFAGQAVLVSPTKSGRVKIAINAMGLDTTKNGFISFMVLRKE